ncbi:MAG TPA: tRNA (adenosine(37)-N6)-dimethylallyltransferase MiaA [Chitinophagales bacterium]|nr:tRNA (adenosine(37)-N6)-dimethylallyltransferase MiaA [Chitinophagales bacterium]HRK25770.1 tRNA (adenosine(37)-N6)-dimethylallyltransferase MiaA [Chitinophagales bacterium]
MVIPPVQLPILLIITGPTASGKTALAITLAQLFNTVILSCDSRQFYREMNIGTAKPTPAELQAAPHYFINSHSVTAPYSVGDFERDALHLLNQLFTQHKVVIMTGGSGLFLRVICEGLNNFPDVLPQTRQHLRHIFETQGIAALQNLLQQLDPVYCQKADMSNPQRLIRALEVCLSSGKPYSAFATGTQVTRPFTCLKFALNLPKEELYSRINQRVDAMLEQGLLQEATGLYPYRHLNALQTVGYQELFDYLDGKTTIEEAVELIKQNTRRYAKRQMTWLRKEKDIIWVNPAQKEQVIQQVCDMVNNNN